VANTGVRCAGCNPREWSLRPHGPTTCPRRAAVVQAEQPNPAHRLVVVPAIAGPIRAG